MLFSRDEHQRVLDCGIDVPGEVPAFPMELSEVGITKKTVWVHVNGQTGVLPFQAEIMLGLPGNMRGIHMSRIEQAITAFHKNKFPDLRAYVLSLGQRIITEQECSGARIAVQGEVPFLQETPVSQNLSVDTITFTVSATFSGRHENPDQLLIGASLHHMTACPCTLSYNQILLKATAASQPLPTHSQRSITHLQVESAEPPYQSPTFGELVTILTSTVHSAQDLLKRPDEAELVLMAHHHPQFAEDVGREIARRVGESFGNRLPEKTRILIESRSLESIHIHDVVARLATTLGKILRTGTP